MEDGFMAWGYELGVRVEDGFRERGYELGVTKP